MVAIALGRISVNGRKRMRKFAQMLLGYHKRLFSKISLSAAVIDSKIDNSAALDSFVRFYNSSIDRYSYVGMGSFINNTSIGAFCSVGGNCTIGAEEHSLSYLSTSPVFTEGHNILGINFCELPVKEASKTTIANDVWIGMGSYIKSGVTISTGAVIGMGSVVTKNVGPYEIWAGNPARFIRKRFSEGTINELLRSEWWAFDTEEIERISHSFSSPEAYLHQRQNE